MFQDHINKLLDAGDPEVVDALSRDIAAELTDENIDDVVEMIMTATKNANIDEPDAFEIVLMIFIDLIKGHKRYIQNTRPHLLKLRTEFRAAGVMCTEDVQDVDDLLLILEQQSNS